MEKVKYLTNEEVRLFFGVVKSIRDRLLFNFLYHYGLRIGEACSIKLLDLHPQLIEIKIPRLKGGIPRTYSIGLQDAKLLKKWLKLRGEYPNAEGNLLGEIRNQGERSINGRLHLDRRKYR